MLQTQNMFFKDLQQSKSFKIDEKQLYKVRTQTLRLRIMLK